MSSMSTMAQRTLLSTVLVGTVSLLGPGQRAIADQPPDDQWHLATNLGGWLTAIDGTVGVRDKQADVYADFSDLIEYTNFAFAPGIEVSKGNLVFAANGSIAMLSDDVRLNDGRGGDVDMNLYIANVAAGYTLVRTKFGDQMPFTFTPAIGGRITSLELKVNPDDAATDSRSCTWFDPYVGGRITLGLTESLTWRTEGTVGGFGVGSRFAWSAGSYIDWQFARQFELNVGYRALYEDYDTNEFKWVVSLYGPWVGLTIRWF